MAMLEELLRWVLRAVGVGDTYISGSRGGVEFSDEHDAGGRGEEEEEEQSPKNSLSFSNAFGSANEDDEVVSSSLNGKKSG